MRSHRAVSLPRLVLLALVGGVTLVGPGRAHDLGSRRVPRAVAERPAAQPPATPSAPASTNAPPGVVYIANDDHLDYMWSGGDDEYRQALPAMLDFYADQAEATAGAASDFRSRFNADGTIWLWMYERARSAGEMDRLMGHVRNGTLTVPINPVVQLYGAMPAEAVLRGFLYAGSLARRYNVTFPLVVPMENQTLPGGVASLWAGAGVKYAWKGICDCATRIDAANRPRELYRFTGPDGQSVLMKWNSLLGDNRSIGGYAEARFPGAAVDLVTGNSEFLSRWPWEVAGAFGYGWDDLQSTTDLFPITAEDRTNFSRRVVVSNEVDFFQDIEARHGAAIESWGGSFGNEWDLLTASLAEVSARVRRSIEKLRAAEALASAVLIHDSTFMVGRTSSRDSAMFSMGLYYEHSFSPGPGVSESERSAWQRSVERAITGYVDQLHADGVAALGAQIARPASATRWFVFNPLGWERTDVADLDLPYGGFQVVEVASGLEVPAQAVTVNGRAMTRILASNVPSVGYRVYEIRSGTPSTFPPSATVSLPGMENAHYRLRLGAHGDIVSLEDRKDGNRQLVLGTGGLFDLGSGSGTVRLVETGPVSTTLAVDAGGDPPHNTQVTLFAPAIDRVAFEGRITGNFGGTEAWSLSFDVPGGAWRHEEVGMIARVARQSAGGDYADQNARTDWLTLNHFADLSQAGRGVTVSSWDSPFFQVGNSTPTTLDATSTVMEALVGMQDDPQIGIANQGGDRAFLNRLAFRTHTGWNAGAAMRFALAHQNPLVAGRCTGDAAAPLPANSWSLLSVNDPEAILWALKPAETGRATDLIARVWNLAPSGRTVQIHTGSHRIASARAVTHLELDLGAVAWLPYQMFDGVESQQMKSWRIGLAGAPTYVPPGRTGLALAVAPNPVVAGGNGAFTFQMPAAGQVRARLFDVTGRVVSDIADEARGPGRNEIVWNSGGLAAGVYLLEVQAAGLTARSRVVVLR